MVLLDGVERFIEQSDGTWLDKTTGIISSTIGLLKTVDIKEILNIDPLHGQTAAGL